MKTFLIRIFAFLIFVLTVTTAVVVVLNVLFGRDDVPPRGPTTPSYIEDEQEQSIGSWFLSRLKLLPTGKLYRTPVVVMIENHEEARKHHEGLSDALMIQEFLVEGFISRFAVVFDYDDLPRRMGPIRSLRPYFVHGLSPWARMFFHAGGSPEALSVVKNEPSISSHNGLYLPDHFLRDKDIPPPHDLFLAKKHLKDLVKKKPKDVAWPPYELGELRPGSGASVISINFFNPDHNVEYTYNAVSGTYDRVNGGIKAKTYPRNLVMLDVPISEVGEFGRLKMNLNGTGDAIYFRGGRIFFGRWKKEGLMKPFEFLDEEGDVFEFSTGQMWITVLPTLNRVTWNEDMQ